MDEEVIIADSTLSDYDWIRVGSIIKNSQILSDTFIGFKCTIINCNIGNHVQIASSATIGAEGGAKAFIEDDVWIGAEAIIDPGIIIHRGAVIGARTHVKHDVAALTVVYGKGETTHLRAALGNEPPNFRQALKQMAKKKTLGHYLERNIDGNYISASFEGFFSNIGTDNICIGDIRFGGGIFLGKDVSIGNGNILEAAGSISIGDNTHIENNVHIVSNSHDYHQMNLPMTLRPVLIGKNVIIHSNVFIMPGIHVNDAATIPSNSFVLKDI